MTRSVADCSADAHYAFVREIAQPADGEIKNRAAPETSLRSRLRAGGIARIACAFRT